MEKISHCSECGGSPLFVRTFCKRCYHRGRLSGAIPRVNARTGGACEFPGCSEKAHARGLCGKHYQRQVKGLKSIWANLRTRNRGTYPSEWDRFDTFVAQIGERPSTEHNFRRLDPTKPWSVENGVWVQELALDVERRSSLDAKRRYAREYAERARYGLQLGEGEAIRKSQNYRCAICNEEETSRARGSLDSKALAIDHCHETEVVRGALCDQHNKALGSFRNVRELQAAIVYLQTIEERTAKWKSLLS